MQEASEQLSPGDRVIYVANEDGRPVRTGVVVPIPPEGVLFVHEPTAEIAAAMFAHVQEDGEDPRYVSRASVRRVWGHDWERNAVRPWWARDPAGDPLVWTRLDGESVTVIEPALGPHNSVHRQLGRVDWKQPLPRMLPEHADVVHGACCRAIVAGLIGQGDRPITELPDYSLREMIAAEDWARSSKGEKRDEDGHTVYSIRMTIDDRALASLYTLAHYTPSTDPVALWSPPGGTSRAVFVLTEQDIDRLHAKLEASREEADNDR